MPPFSSKGFFIFEAVLALALFSLCVFSTVSLSWGAEQAFGRARAEQGLLDALRPVVLDPDGAPYAFARSQYGNDGTLVSLSSSTSLSSASPFKASFDSSYLTADGFEGYGKDSCPHDLALPADFPAIAASGSAPVSALLPISPGNAITGLLVRDGVAYVSADSNVSSDPDFFIFDLDDPSEPKLLSSLDTGPGLAALAVAGPYVYAAERSSANQLQAIDIHDRSHPALLASAKVPLDNASSTRPFGSAIFYDKGSVYLGTEKGDSPELTVWSVADPADPILAGRFEGGAKVESITVSGKLAYVASTGQDQLMEFDISDTAHPALLSTYAPPGWQTASGQAIGLFEGDVALGRDTGGFNVAANPEFILYGKGSAAASSSFDEPGGVYGIVARPLAFLVLTHRASSALRLDDEAGSTSASYDVPGIPAALACDGGTMYVASNGPASLTTIADLRER